MIQTRIVNDKTPSYIKSITFHQMKPDDIFGCWIDVDVNFINGLRPSHCEITGKFELGKLQYAVAEFLEKNKFAIGPLFLNKVWEHMKILWRPDFKLPTENQLRIELYTLISLSKYTEALKLLHTVEKFLHPELSYKQVPNDNILMRCLEKLQLSSISKYAHITSGQLNELRLIVDLLLKKGFYVSDFLFPIDMQSKNRDEASQQIHDASMGLINYLDGIDPDDDKLKGKIEQTALWSLKEPQVQKSPVGYELNDFRNNTLEYNKFVALRDYFKKVSLLFDDSKKCLEYLKPIDEALKSISFDGVNLKPSGYLANRAFNIPCPPQDYVGVKKNNSLRKAILDFFTQKNKEHPEINILLTGEFWDAFSFIDTSIANGLVEKGGLFWEKRYARNSNAHGSATHPLQILILAMAHLSNECTFPPDTTLREILAIMVSDKMTLLRGPVWNKLFDITYYSFCCPMFIQSTLMSNLGKSICPNLFNYTCDSLWQHYMVVSKAKKMPVEALIFLDIFAFGYFSSSNLFSFSNLLERYKEKKISVEQYSAGCPTLFKKRYPAKQDADSNVIKDEMSVTL